MEDIMSINLDDCFAATTCSDRAVLTKENLEKLVEQISAMPKFVVRMEMSEDTYEVEFKKIIERHHPCEGDRFTDASVTFLGMDIVINQELHRGLIKKIYNDGSEENEYLFKLNYTTYGIYNQI